ncbi:MAG: hypothetical protein D6762_04615 [Candidatus Neomarinimicrobiota bacterium]|nr:MAG: hypothetical protein D6762_04615 [Candidatus Neomarinimicrobiota bacterium]
MRKSLWPLTLMVTACGIYSMAGSIPPHIHTIAIPLLENRTAEFGVVEDMTDILQEKFVEENILQVVPEDRADSILKGTVEKIEDVPYTFNAQEEVTEYRYTVVMDITWEDKIENKVLLQKKFTGWGAYGTSSDISNDQIDNDGDGKIDAEDPDEFGDPRTFAQQSAIRKIAEDIVNSLLTTW